MPRVRWTARAAQEADRILAYIQRFNPRAASDLADEIVAKTDGLAEFPGMGRPVEGRPTRELVVHPNYVVLYRATEQEVLVLRLTHAARRR